MKKTVLIVGAGIGGLATALRLLSKGYNVKVFEKENSIGGKMNQIAHNPYIFDLTASILMNRQCYEEVFSDAGLDYNDYIEFVKIDPTYRCFYPDKFQLDIPRDIVQLTQQLEAISTQNSTGYFQLLSQVYQRYVIADQHFLRHSFDKPQDFFAPTPVAKALKTKALSTSAQLIAKHVQSKYLRRFLAYQALYVGISPFEGSSVYTFIPVMAQLHGLWHIPGGLYSYIRALEKAIYSLGGKIFINSPVEEILISQQRAVGITTKGKNIAGDIVISSADFPYTVGSLLKNKDHQGQYTTAKLEKMDYTCSAFILYLGLNKEYPQLSAHNLYLNEDFKQNIQAAFTGKLPAAPSFYFYCPSRIDRSMAKSGDCLSAVVRVPNLFANLDWNDEETILGLKNSIISALKNIPGLEDIESNIAYQSYLTPNDLKQRFNSYAGTAFGLSPTLTQANYFRPHIKSDKVEGLYFVGQSVHPGPGASLVLLSSKLAVQDILCNNSAM